MQNLATCAALGKLIFGTKSIYIKDEPIRSWLETELIKRVKLDPVLGIDLKNKLIGGGKGILASCAGGLFEAHRRGGL